MTLLQAYNMKHISRFSHSTWRSNTSTSELATTENPKMIKALGTVFISGNIE